MGLDARVFCNCYELGRLRTQPPYSRYIDEFGAVCSRNREHVNEFDEWRQSACEQEFGWAVPHYIGNIALVAFLRNKLGNIPNTFPLILRKVIYNGIHSGDYIDVDEVETLQREILELRAIHADNEEDKTILRRFEQQMSELIAWSLQMGKPIGF